MRKADSPLDRIPVIIPFILITQFVTWKKTFTKAFEIAPGVMETNDTTYEIFFEKSS